MSRLAFFLTALWLSTAATQAKLFKPNDKGAGGKKDALSDLTAERESEECEHIKELFGVSYDEYEGREPDLSRLTLNYITRSINITYRLSDAAKLIPESKWYKPNKTFTIYVHGFMDNPFNTAYVNISNAYYDRDDYNIVAVDSSSLIGWYYLRSSTMVHFVGTELGKMLANLIEASLLDWNNIHLVGHSLGCHIAGHAGKTVRSMTGKNVSRITALDPARPCFSKVNSTQRLDATDAKFVDVIHTNAGSYALDEQLGHVDFYPNGGSNQTNCHVAPCNHNRAWQLFIDSVINPDSFVGVSCSSWEEFRKGKCDYKNKSLMGFGCPEGTTGKYYLQTNGDTPYGRCENGMKYSRILEWSSQRWI